MVAQAGGDSDQAVFAFPLVRTALLVNFTTWPGVVMLTDCGVMVRALGALAGTGNVTVALAVNTPATVNRIVTAVEPVPGAGDGKTAGAVYLPVSEIAPQSAARGQSSAHTIGLPVKLGVNCTVWPGVAIATDWGERVSCAERVKTNARSKTESFMPSGDTSTGRWRGSALTPSLGGKLESSNAGRPG
jgi:hypothetical protein